MAKWGVTLPVSGSVYCEVEAETEEAAITEALCNGDWDSDSLQWEVHRNIVKGNVCYAMQREADAERLPDDE